MDARQTQLRLLLVAGVLYLLCAALLLPAPHRPMAAVGLVAFPLLWWGARHITGLPNGYEVAGIAFINAVVFLIFVAKDAPGSRWVSFGTGCFGALAATGFWVVHRFTFPQLPPVPLGARVLASIRAGVFVALFLSAVATVPLLLALLSDPARRVALLHVAGFVYGAYFAAGIGVGLLVGLLLPITHWALARLLLGFLGGVALYAAVGPAVTLIDRLEGKPVTDTSELLGIAILLGLIVGPGPAFSVGDS